MSILVCGGVKGGTGKSTLSTNLAVARAETGRSVVLVDTDGQASSTLWHQDRVARNPAPTIHVDLETLRGKGIYRRLQELDAGHYDDVVIDAGGRDTTELREAIAVCDVCLFPLGVGQYDLNSLEQIAPLVQSATAAGADFRARVVLNLVPTHPTMREWREARDAVGDYDEFDLARAMIRTRVAWRRTAEEGLGVIEPSAPDPRAVDELMSLYREVWNG